MMFAMKNEAGGKKKGNLERIKMMKADLGKWKGGSATAEDAKKKIKNLEERGLSEKKL